MEFSSITHEGMTDAPCPCPATVRDVIQLWPARRELGEAVGVEVSRVHKWAQANAIPAKFQQSVIDAAQARGFSIVTASLMVALHDARTVASVGCEA